MTNHDALNDLVDEVVVLPNVSGPPSLNRKIALLGFVLEQLKYERSINREEVSFEEYLQSEVNVIGSKVVISAPSVLRHQGNGTSPIQLQAPLLLFLLLNYKERYQVLEIIKAFIEQIRSQLIFLDFKKTETGVTRCFTNTRFAATVLRDYGLLRFTKRQAFKTWELSLAGFLVAASLLERRANQKRPWYAFDSERDWKFDLLPEIQKECGGSASYDEFVARLVAICKPDAKLFKTFEPALRQAFSLLQEYWAILSDQTKTRKERREASLQRIKQLDGLGETFFQELSCCIQINDLLRRTLQTEGTSTYS